MISLEEILQGANFKELPDTVQHNLEVLVERINIIRSEYGKPMKVSSGLRTMKKHLEIYERKGITDKKKIPMKSRHLVGGAVDIADPKQELQKWCFTNIEKLKEAELWMEDFEATPTWCHFQISPPKSGKRFFKP